MSMLDNGSVPPGYVDPQQIQQRLLYQHRLAQGATRDEPMTSPWQGARMMADALAMNRVGNQAGGAQQQNQRLLGNVNTDATLQSQPPGAGTPTPPIRSPMPPPQAQSMAPPPPPMTGAPPVGMSGSIPAAQPGGPPSAPPGLTSGMQLPGLAGLGGMGGGQPPNPMMQALMTQPPG